MHYDFRIFTRLTEAACKLGRFDDRALRDLFSRRIANDDVRAGIIARVHPQVVWLRDPKRQIVVVACGASHEDLITVSRKVTPNAGKFLRLG